MIPSNYSSQTVIFLLLAAAAGGFYVGKSADGNSAPPTTPIAEETRCESSGSEVCADLDRLKNQLSGLSPAEIQEYLQTQSAEEKLKKADEILGKIMSALVATVGYRLQKSDLDQLGQLSKQIDTQPKAAKPVEVATEPAPIPAKPIATAPPANPQLQRDIRNARTEEEAKALLETLGSEFGKRIQSSSTLNRDQMRELTGRFEGAILKREKSFRTTLDFQGRMRNEVITGQATVEIFNPEGQRISQGRSSGNLTKSYSASGPVVFIECGGDYFELIYFPSLGQWLGNYLEMEKGVLKKTGDVVLRRI